MSAKTAQAVDAKELFETVEEGDQLLWDGRDEPVTVYRHVTEDDARGQVISMKEMQEHHVLNLEWEAKHQDECAESVNASEGDLVKGPLTGEEFLIARGPRDGAYLLTQWWDKHAGRWTTDVALYRITREGDSEVWQWENTVTVQTVGHEDVNRDAFDAGIEAVVTDPAGRTVWTGFKAEEHSKYDEEMADDSADNSGGVQTAFGPMCTECRERRPREDGMCWHCHPDHPPK